MSKGNANQYKNSLAVDILLLMVSGKKQIAKQLRRQASGLAWREQISAKHFNNAINQLHKSNWIEKKRYKDDTFYQLTKRGEIKQILLNLKKYSRIRSDRATIVIFDIPEQKRTYRNAVRRLLKDMDFTMLQKSVFITPNSLPDLFYDYLREMKLLEYFQFVEGWIKTKI
jgi:DNA-binding transcriptional regulator PaaX